MERAPESESIAIFHWLFGLTLSDLIAVCLPVSRTFVVATLIGLAIAKSTLVATYFSQWRLDRKTIGLVAIGPPFVLLLMAALLQSETAWRVWIH